MQPGSQLSINAVEGFPLDDFSADVSIHTDIGLFHWLIGICQRLYALKSPKPKR